MSLIHKYTLGSGLTHEPESILVLDFNLLL
jgi:hypothetical protein